MPAVKFKEEQIRALEYGWGMCRTMLSNSYSYLYIGHFLFIMITVLTMATIVTTTCESLVFLICAWHRAVAVPGAEMKMPPFQGTAR